MPHTGAQLIRQAVLQSPAFTTQGLLERFFVRWFSGFVYNQIWEDPRVDLEALAIEPHHRMLTIASGGCNVCHYLLAGAESVTAVDLNIHHVRLTRLKLAAARRLPDHEAFFRFFGHAADATNLWNFDRHIKPHLPEEDASYWEARRSPLGGRRIDLFAENLYDHARMGSFLRLLRSLCRLTGRDPERILQARTLEEQRRAYEKELEPLLTGRLAEFLSRFAVAVFSLGIPPQQYRALRRESPGGVLAEYRKRAMKLACGFPLEDNPFAWQAFGRRYDRHGRKALPEYLRAQNFSALQARADKAQVIQDSFLSHLERQPARCLDRYVLLDAQDWMTPEALRALWAEMARTARPGARVIFRTAGEVSPLEDILTPELKARFTYREEDSRRLTPLDRSCLYGGFHLYEFTG